MSFFTYQDILGRKSDLVRAYLDALTIALEKNWIKSQKCMCMGSLKITVVFCVL